MYADINPGSTASFHTSLKLSRSLMRWFFELDQIGSGLKKIFEDGVVKREENLHPILEVEIVRHAYKGNWRREKQKNKNEVVEVNQSGIAGFEDVKIKDDDASVEQAEHNAGSVLGSAPVDKPAKHNP
nr:hypothetical protein [Tanacetum cinerariifolium]